MTPNNITVRSPKTRKVRCLYIEQKAKEKRHDHQNNLGEDKVLSDDIRYARCSAGGIPWRYPPGLCSTTIRTQVISGSGRSHSTFILPAEICPIFSRRKTKMLLIKNKIARAVKLGLFKNILLSVAAKRIESVLPQRYIPVQYGEPLC